MNNETYTQFVKFLEYIRTTNQKPPMAAKILWQLGNGISKCLSVDQIKSFANDYYVYVTTGVAGSSPITGSVLDDALCEGGGEYVGTNTAYKDIPSDIKVWHPLTGQSAYGVSIGNSRPYGFARLNYSVPAFRFDMTEYNAVINRVNTPAEVATAQFWAAGGGTYTPPGMWVKSALEQTKTRPDFIKIMYYLTNAVANASIACWAVKYKYSSARPQNLAPSGWVPTIATPPFPGYVSGHSAFSQAAGSVFSFFNIDPIVIGAASTRTYTSIQDAVDEAGISRIYGQIHIPQDNEQGKSLGEQIAIQTLTLPWGSGC